MWLSQLLRSSSNCYEAVVLLPVEFRQIKAIDMKVTRAVIFESARLARWLLVFFGKPAAAMPGANCDADAAGLPEPLRANRPKASRRFAASTTPSLLPDRKASNEWREDDTSGQPGLHAASRCELSPEKHKTETPNCGSFENCPV